MYQQVQLETHKWVLRKRPAKGRSHRAISRRKDVEADLAQARTQLQYMQLNSEKPGCNPEAQVVQQKKIERIHKKLHKLKQPMPAKD